MSASHRILYSGLYASHTQRTRMNDECNILLRQWSAEYHYILILSQTKLKTIVQCNMHLASEICNSTQTVN